MAWWVRNLHDERSEAESTTVPSNDEISFVLEILEHIVSPALDKIEALLTSAGSWDGVARNDFCRQVLNYFPFVGS